MESTFVAVMFFGWGKVSKRFHLASTWLTIIGASISAVWILIANAWMQNPVGMAFNPDTMRSEMADFWSVALSSTALIKIAHTLTSSWVLGALFSGGVAAFYALKKKNSEFVIRNFKIIAPFGLVAALLAAETGHISAVDVYEHQPMKLAAMEALYESGQCTVTHECADGNGMPLSAFGILNPSKQKPDDGVEPFLFNIELPHVLSVMSTNTLNAYAPGVNNILRGDYYLPNGEKAISVEERMLRGRKAVNALRDYSIAKRAGDTIAASQHKAILDENFAHFGYGYFDSKYEAVPNVPVVYYSFRAMVTLGGAFILLFALLSWFAYRPAGTDIDKRKWLMWFALLMAPMAWVASQTGWVVAEMGRQPWTIQNLLPVRAAVSQLEASSVIVTFVLFAVLFTVMLVAELNIMKKAISSGPDAH